MRQLAQQDPQSQIGQLRLAISTGQLFFNGGKTDVIRDSDGPAASTILAFSERQLLANNGHERAFRLRPVYTRKRTSITDFANLSCSILQFYRSSNTIVFV